MYIYVCSLVILQISLLFGLYFQQPGVQSRDAKDNLKEYSF